VKVDDDRKKDRKEKARHMQWWRKEKERKTSVLFTDIHNIR
jgi:hypothetical protein